MLLYQQKKKKNAYELVPRKCARIVRKGSGLKHFKATKIETVRCSVVSLRSIFVSEERWLCRTF